MTLRLLAPDEAVRRSPDTPTVCVLLPDEHDRVAETILGITRHTPSHVPILLAGAPPASLESIAGLLDEQDVDEREILLLALEPEVGFSAAINAACAVLGARDIVLVAYGVRVGPGWLGRMTHAAHCDSTVVSATALHDGDGFLGVGVRGSQANGSQANGSQANGAPLAQPEAALVVSAHSPCVYPRIQRAGLHCVYLRRELFDRLGGLDASISDPVEGLAEISRRALSLGMLHVAADDVFVTCAPVVQATPPDLPTPDSQDKRTVLHRSLVCARAGLYGISVTIDARALGSGVGGTQLYTAELILALTADARLRVRAVVPPDLPPALIRRFAGQPALETITYEQATAGVELSDVVHRPQQVFSEDDLTLLQMLGERVVIGQQDLIGYRNPDYHQTVDHWQRYRRVTRLALAVADRAVFFSEHAKHDALSEDLVAGERGDVIGIGAELLSRDPVAPVAPERVGGVPGDREVLVCIGADYKHKNRPFAIAMLHELRERHGWGGCLVLAGSHVQYGSSREEESALLARHPDLAASVVDLGPVSEAEKAWLYEQARAVIYPTLYEGFGLIPFEAARAGTPCLYAPQAALVELAGLEAATLIPWDPALSSDAAIALLRNGPERERHLRLLGERMANSTWGDLVERLVKTYEEAIRAPFRAAAPRAWQELQRERLIVELADNAAANNRAYNDLMASVGAGLPLVAEGGLLSRDEQRGLMRIASRRPLHRMILSPFGALGRVQARAQADPELHSKAEDGSRSGAHLASDDVDAHW